MHLENITTKMIVISGKAQSGKDTVANMLMETMENEGFRVEILHYADLLKYLCKELYGWDGKKDEFGRALLQHVGTDIVRAKNVDFWANFIRDIVLIFGEKCKWDYVIVPDCRFPNEIEVPKASGIDVFHLHIVRDGFENDLTNEQQVHESEMAIDGYYYDYLLRNNSDLDELKKIVYVLMVRILIWTEYLMRAVGD